MHGIHRIPKRQRHSKTPHAGHSPNYIHPPAGHSQDIPLYAEHAKAFNNKKRRAFKRFSPRWANYNMHFQQSIQAFKNVEHAKAGFPPRMQAPSSPFIKVEFLFMHWQRFLHAEVPMRS